MCEDLIRYMWLVLKSTWHVVGYSLDKHFCSYVPSRKCTEREREREQEFVESAEREREQEPFLMNMN